MTVINKQERQFRLNGELQRQFASAQRMELCQKVRGIRRGLGLLAIVTVFGIYHWAAEFGFAPGIMIGHGFLNAVASVACVIAGVVAVCSPLIAAILLIEHQRAQFEKSEHLDFLARCEEMAAADEAQAAQAGFAVSARSA